MGQLHDVVETFSAVEGDERVDEGGEAGEDLIAVVLESAVPFVPGVEEDPHGEGALDEGVLRVPEGDLARGPEDLIGEVGEVVREGPEEVIPLVGGVGRGRDVVVHVSVVPQVGVDCTRVSLFLSALVELHRSPQSGEGSGVDPHRVGARDGKPQAHLHGIAVRDATRVDGHDDRLRDEAREGDALAGSDVLVVHVLPYTSGGDRLHGTTHPEDDLALSDAGEPAGSSCNSGVCALQSDPGEVQGCLVVVVEVLRHALCILGVDSAQEALPDCGEVATGGGSLVCGDVEESGRLHGSFIPHTREVCT